MSSRNSTRGRPAYRRLDPGRISETIVTLSTRVRERFPTSGLANVAGELVGTCDDAVRLAGWLGRPLWWVRGLVVATVVILGALAIAMFLAIPRRAALFSSVADLAQGFDAVVNELVLLGLAVFVMSSWETRIKRHRALAALHELRSLAHIVDMHQLTKDPVRLLQAGRRTASSPRVELSRYELVRYLGYCSEMVSLVSKIAALYVEDFDDAVTLDTVNEIESLCAGASRKVWQKIMILDPVAGAADA